MLTFADLIEGLTNFRPVATKVITEAAIDSRQVNPGSLFVAIRGENLDGHDFVMHAFQSGAVAALIEREIKDTSSEQGNPSILTVDLRGGRVNDTEIKFINEFPTIPVCFLVDNTIIALQKIAASWRRKLNLRVIGITGSVGKSTTKEAIAQVLSQRYQTLKSNANLNNEIGLPLNILRLTPVHQRAVLEMGFYIPGDIKLLCEIAQPHVGVITNIGTVHAERAGSKENIAAGKSELLEALPAAPEGIAILNYDDPYVRPMKNRTNARIFFYGTDSNADLWADNVDSNGLEGIRFRMHYRKETLHIHVPMIGRHSVETALRASAVGLVEGLGWDEIIRGLKESSAQLSLSVVRSKNGAIIIDDTYNASPESTLAALNLLGELKGQKIGVLGDMLELGQYEQEGHEKVGFRAAEVVDILLTLGTRAHMLAEAARKGGLSKNAVFEFEEIEDVIDWLNKNLNSNQAVLIKGSHSMHMESISAALEVHR